MIDAMRSRLLSLRRDWLSVSAMLFSIAVGGTTIIAVSAVADALLLDPLPEIRSAESLVAPHTRWPGGLFNSFSYRQFSMLRHADDVATAAAYTHRRASIGTGRALVYTDVALVSTDYFRLLGVTQTRGRLFTARDDRSVDPNAVIVTRRLAGALFGADDAAVGQEVRVNGSPFKVAGVVGATFRGVDLVHPCDAFLPLAAAPIVYRSLGANSSLTNAPSREIPWLSIIARLRPGAATANAERTIQRLLGEERPLVLLPFRQTVLPMSEQPRVRNFLLLLAALTALLWTVVVGNVSMLLLGRSIAERRDTAVRLALGAPGYHSFVRRLVESTVIGAVGGALAMAAAAWLLPLVSEGSLPGQIPIGELQVRLNWRIVGFSLLAVWLAGAIASLFAYRSCRRDCTSSLLAEASRTDPLPARSRSRLLTAQVALAVASLVLTGLLVREVQRGTSADFGFTRANVVLASIDLESLGYPGSAGLLQWDRLLTRIRTMPGVLSATVTTNYFGRGGRSLTSVWMNGFERPHRLFVNYVASDYFGTVGIRLLRGRDFTAADRAGTPMVAIVNAAMAEAAWPGLDPVDRTFSLAANGTPIRVVGVAADSLQMKLGEGTEAGLYVPLWQYPELGAREKTLAVRTEVPLDAMRENIRKELGSLDPNVALSGDGTLVAAVQRTLLPQRTALRYCGCVSFFSLLLVFAAVYGLVSKSVISRTREIGIRMSLGANRRDVVSFAVVSHLARPLVVGTAFGAGIGFALSRLLSSWVPDLAALDPLSIGAAALAVAVVAASASAVPALRATRVDPAAALRT